eukprot:375115_1
MAAQSQSQHLLNPADIEDDGLRNVLNKSVAAWVHALTFSHLWSMVYFTWKLLLSIMFVVAIDHGNYVCHLIVFCFRQLVFGYTSQSAFICFISYILDIMENSPICSNIQLTNHPFSTLLLDSIYLKVKPNTFVCSYCCFYLDVLCSLSPSF